MPTFVPAHNQDTRALPVRTAQPKKNESPAAQSDIAGSTVDERVGPTPTTRPALSSDHHHHHQQREPSPAVGEEGEPPQQGQVQAQKMSPPAAMDTSEDAGVGDGDEIVDVGAEEGDAGGWDIGDNGPDFGGGGGSCDDSSEVDEIRVESEEEEKQNNGSKGEQDAVSVSELFGCLGVAALYIGAGKNRVVY